MYMNKLFIYFFVLFSVSCTESIELSSTLKKRIVNKSDKTIVNEIQSEVGTITKYIYSNDSVDLMINKKITTESSFFGLASPHTPKLNIYHDILYNLTDTTKVELLTSVNSYNYDIYFDDPPSHRICKKMNRIPIMRNGRRDFFQSRLLASEDFQSFFRYFIFQFICI